MRIQVFLLSSLLSASLTAQELHIYHDVFRDTTWYVLDGKPLKQARVHKNGVIQVHLLEFNNYLYSAEMSAEEIRAGGSGLGGGLSGLAGLLPGGDSSATGGGGFLGLLGKMTMPGFQTPIFGGSGGLSLSSFLEKSRGGASGQAMTDALATAQEMAEMEPKIRQTVSELRSTAQALAVSSFARKKMSEILKNPALPPSEIRRISREYYSTLFGLSPGDTLTLARSLAWAERPAKMAEKTAALAQLQNDWNKLAARLETQAKNLRQFDLNETEWLGNVAVLEKKSMETKQFGAGIAPVISGAEAFGKLGSGFSAEELADLQVRQAELQANNFTHSRVFLPAGENMSIEAQIFQTENAGKADAKPVKTRSFNVRTYGGLKITASGGLNFAQYFNRPKRYSTREGIIVAEGDDKFLPVVSSQIHFLPDRGGRFALGGSFGIGMPLLSGDQAQSVMFFLGPSLVFGQAQRAVLSFGILGGKTSRLAKGFQVGDVFDPSAGDIPLSSKYDYGYFLGVSFNFASR